jgi:OOP family OmpA-OmpF porin
MKTTFYTLSMAGLLAVLGGCSSTPMTQVSQIPADANPQEQVAQFEGEVKDAQVNHYSWLAPTHFKKAQQELVEAQSILKSQGKNTDIFKHIELGRAALQDTDRYAKIAQSSLPEAIKAREESMAARAEAEKAGAKNLSETYEDADSYFLKLTTAAETDDLKWAESHQGDAIKKYRTAGAGANKKRFLDSAKGMIDLAKKEGASSYAPTALKAAQERFEATETFSDNNPYATDQILKRGEETLGLAKRALNLTRESQMLDRWEPEQRVVWVENNLKRVGKTLALGDMSDKSFDTQVAAIEKAMTNVRQVASAAEGAKEQAQALQSENRELKTSVTHAAAWSQKFDTIRQQFDPSEAEVLRDGDNVIIRLRDIHFTVGKAQIPTKDFALLKKVEKAIGEFDNSKVIVEGHTDSTGSAALNQKLSEKRAGSVREYLVANESVSPDEISAVGMGFTKPLADNKTAAGRATNRRVDIIIEPGDSVSASGEGSDEEPTSAE